jgi:hypothetical protein
MSDYTVLLSKEEMNNKIKKSSEANEKICIIFGAGASLGYSKNHYYKTPIVRDLFDDKSNNTVMEVINKPANKSLKNNKGDYLHDLKDYEYDLEKYLSYLYKKNPEDNIFSNFLTYLEDIFFLSSEKVDDTFNNYKSLINIMYRLYGKDLWSCISFNYDTIFEKSYLLTDRDTSRRNFSNLDDYINMKPVILKMHGGINFRYLLCRPVSDISISNNHSIFSEMMREKRDVDTFLQVIDIESPEPEPYHTPEYNHDSKRMERKVNFPLMLIPIHASITPENIFFKEQIKLAKKQMEEASLIISIGYNFGDEAFTNELIDIDLSKKEIILVDIQESIDKIVDYNGYKRAKKIFSDANVRIFDGDGFGDFVNAIR